MEGIQHSGIAGDEGGKKSVRKSNWGGRLVPSYFGTPSNPGFLPGMASKVPSLAVQLFKV